MVHVSLKSIFDNDFVVRLKAWGAFDNKCMLEQVQNTIVVDSWEALQSLEQMPLERQDARLHDHYSTTVNKLVIGHQLIAPDDKIKYFGAFKGQKNAKSLGDLLFGQAVHARYKTIKPTITKVHIMIPKDPASGKTWANVFDEIKHTLFIDHLVVSHLPYLFSFTNTFYACGSCRFTGQSKLS